MAKEKSLDSKAKKGLRIRLPWTNKNKDGQKRQFRFSKKAMGGWFTSFGRWITNIALWLYYNPLLQVIFVIGVFLAINVIGLRFFYRLDATRYQSYTFSPAIKSSVKNLTTDLTIKLFLSSDLPSGINNIPEEIRDYYIELQRLNPKHVKIQYYDPGKANEDTTAATEYSISPIQYADPKGNRATVGNAYLGVGFDYKDQKDSIPEVRSSEELELQTLLVVRKFTQENKPRIGFVTGHGELALSTEYPNLDNWIRSQFTVDQVSLNEVQDPSKYQELVVLAPNTNYSDEELMVLDQYILKGGRVLFIMEGYSILDDQNASVIQTNVFDLLKSYGVDHENGLVLDQSYNPFVAQGLPLIYPYWVRIPSDYLNTSNGILRNVQSVNLAWAIDFKPELTRYKDKPQPTLTPLIRSTEGGAVVLGDTVPIALQQNFTFPNPGQKVLSYEVSGNVLSYFDGAKNKDTIAKKVQKVQGKAFSYQSSSDKADFIVIGDSDFLLDRSQFGLPSNVDVFLRMLYWGVNDQEMLTLKTPVVQIPWSKTVTDNQIQWYKAGNFAFAAIALAAAGTAYWALSRRQRPQF